MVTGLTYQPFLPSGVAGVGPRSVMTGLVLSMRAERVLVAELPAASVTVFETVIGALSPRDSLEAVSAKLESAAALRPERASEAVKLAVRSVLRQPESFMSAPEIWGAVLSTLTVTS